MAAINQSGDRSMNEVNETLREINVTIAFFKRKIAACEEAIETLESEKLEIMKKYNMGVDQE